MKPRSKVLIIAGSDSSGGAGIQADLRTVTTLGSYAVTTITAVTAQNTTGVKSIVPIKPMEISRQIEFSAKDIKPDAIKIGMLHSKPVIQAVIKSLQKLNTKKIVLDPVMVAKGGTKLINNSAINIIKKNGFKVFERHIEINELENFEQCWLTGTAAEVTPVGQIGEYNFEVGSFVKNLVSNYEQIVRE